MLHQIKINKIKANPNNPRLIKGDKFKKLVQSIKDFPEMLKLRPIVVNKEMVVLGGNMRLKACIDAGLKEIWIAKAWDLTPEQENEFIIKDNVGFGDWDWDVLANEWDVKELENWGLEGFPFEEDVLEAEEDDYSEPDNMQVDVVLGDLIEIGEHRLLCGDSTDADQVAKLMNGEKADMVFTDPPYGMNLDTDYSGLNWGDRKGKKYEKVIGDNEDFKPELITTLFKNFNYCKEFFLWGADYYYKYLENFDNGHYIVWDKTLDSNGDAGSNSEFELLWTKQKHKRQVIHFNWFRYFGLSKQDVKKRIHPTQKPLQVLTPFIKDYSKKDNIIIDLYLGSGSTMVAAHQLRRKCYGMELDPKYCQVIIDRMVKLDSNLIVKINSKEYEQK